MKRLIIIFLMTCCTAQIAFGNAIDFGNSTLIKRLKMSFENPIDLFQTNNGAGLAHDDKFFTARTIVRLGPEFDANDRRAIRNETCASYNIFVQGANQGLDIRWMPGSMGIYLKDNNIVSIADHGLTGERLDSVLRKLANETDAVKEFAALYYAVAMTKNLEIIHRAGIIWNNAHLRNFYVRPEGTLYAVDFTEAEKPGAALLAVAQEREWKDFVVNTVQQMYSLLFPPDLAQAQYVALVNGSGAHANWRTDAWTQALFITELDHILASGFDATPAVPKAGGLSDTGRGAQAPGGGAGGYANISAGGIDNATQFLTRANNIPYKPNVGLVNNIAKGDHTSAQNVLGNPAFLGDQGFALADSVRLLTDSGNGTPYSRLDHPNQAGDTSNMCLTWTGKN